MAKALRPVHPLLPFEEAEASGSTAPEPVGATLAGREEERVALPVSAPPRVPEAVSPAFLASLREQIIRDSGVLREDPLYHVPSRTFYEERIEAFRSYLRELEARG